MRSASVANLNLGSVIMIILLVLLLLLLMMMMVTILRSISRLCHNLKHFLAVVPFSKPLRCRIMIKVNAINEVKRGSFCSAGEPKLYGNASMIVDSCLLWADDS